MQVENSMLPDLQTRPVHRSSDESLASHSVGCLFAERSRERCVFAIAIKMNKNMTSNFRTTKSCTRQYYKVERDYSITNKLAHKMMTTVTQDHALFVRNVHTNHSMSRTYSA